jgi:4-hydroxy-tetrahydrodipicolinate reductase
VSATRVIVAGAAGRMGGALIDAISKDAHFALVGALEAHGHPDLGKEMGGVMLTDNVKAVIGNADVIIDFTAPKVSVALASLAGEAKVAHVIGATGCSAEDDEKIADAARNTVIVKSGNMSLGINVLAKLVKQAAKALPDYDVEIVEMHHRMKVDAPSGTALMLGRAAAEARGISLEDHAVKSREGQTGAREKGAIGFAALRGGTVVGEHEVILAGPGERLVLGHVAEDRTLFVPGALAAARWTKGKAPGLYTMADVLAD